MNQPLKPKTFDLPVIGRAATVNEASINAEERTVEIVWTTGAVVQRVRWEGWDDRIDYDEELIVNDKSIRMDRMNGPAGIPFLDSHRSWGTEAVIGTVVPGSVKIEGGQGVATIRLSSAPGCADIVHKIMERTIRSVSVGYRVHEYKITKRDGQRELWQAVDWEPMEISAVAMPADAGAVIRSGNAGAEPALHPCLIIRQEQPAAQSAQSKGKTMTDKTNPGGGADDQNRANPNPPTPPAPPAAPTADAIRADVLATTTTVLDLCARHGLDAKFGTEMIGKGLSLDAIRGAILDKIAERDAAGGRTTEPVFAQARTGESANDVAFRDGMENAILHRANPGAVKLTEPGRQFRGLTLIEMAREALQRRGVNTRGMSRLEVAGEALLGRAAVGYHGGSDFPSILANVANKSLRAAYDGTPRTFVAWAKQTSIPDFKQVQRTQLGGAPDLLRVPESGEFTYGTIGEGKEVYALTTYGRIIGINRQTLINDDLDAFTRVPTAFGASAADLESDLVYGVLIANANMNDGVALFHATHGNLGTAAAITEASLAEAYRAFGNQKGLEGRVISVQPRYIITPPGTRSVEARKNVTATTPSAVAGVNAFAGRLETIEEARLIPAAGADPWFLSADPSRVDTVEYAYLDGANGIFTETRTGFEVDGIEIKARHDFAAKAIDWRGLFKNAGV
ncbi:major capsid and protease fusion protein [Rhodobacter phage RcKai]|nr:major capsid and protease fusion protein [Rhodobacter phage RcBaka]QXN71439.1 major capsid and protease fusion protein [Rhodobacter phage RcHotPocket]UUV43581.1 major capsid and protease fusion protein [Rhodobacter phage RcKai]UUV44312.1 major capsid and protease fusion protein [Rhodobacter phage RcMeacham]UUV44862.1 major capsid and protease fusion protein [Rhodobacter phage RcSwan]